MARAPQLISLEINTKQFLSIDFAADIDEGDAISAASFEVTWDDTNLITTDLTYAAPVVNGTAIELGVQNLNDTSRTALGSVQATLNSGQLYAKHLTLACLQRMPISYLKLVDNEVYDIDFDFTDSKRTGDSIASTNATAIWQDDSSDASAVLVGSPTPTGDVVRQRVQHVDAGAGRVALVQMAATMTLTPVVETLNLTIGVILD